MIKFLFILLFILAGCLATIDNISSLAGDFENVRVLRVLDLTSSIVREDIAIRAKNIKSTATNTYYFIIPFIYRPYIASYKAKSKEGTKDSLEMESVGLDVTQKIHLFKIHFNKLIQPDQDVKFGISIVYTHLVRPLPEKIPQISKQHITFANNIYLFSAYSSNNMKTTYVFPSSNIVTFVGGEPNRTGVKTQNKIVYGSYNHLEPLSMSSGNFHYEYKSPIITVTNLKREIELSHWGNNLAIEEHYALSHHGAKLEKEFNRIEFQLAPHIIEQTNVLTDLVFHLPKNAKDVYYRDEIGNVSTSNFRTEKHKSVLEIQPRFPLFGGWKTAWYTGYNLPLKDYIRYFNGEYILKVQFVENVQGMVIDHVQVKVIFPEGATDIKIMPPPTFEIDSLEVTSHYTYFDSTGRPSVTFLKKNVISDHEESIMISYKYSPIRLLQKPLVTTAAYFILCLLSIFISKIPWTISNCLEQESQDLSSPKDFLKASKTPVKRGNKKSLTSSSEETKPKVNNETKKKV